MNNNNKSDYEYYSPKSMDVASDSKIFYEITGGAKNRGKLFNDYDRTLMKKSVELQDEIVWSEKNISISIQKNNSNQIKKPLNELQNLSFSQHQEVEGLGLNKIIDRSNIPLINMKNIPSQPIIQKVQSDEKNTTPIENKQLFHQSQSRTLITGPNEKRYTEFGQGLGGGQNSPEKITDKSKSAQKKFQVMMYVKKFQNKILKKSPSYLFKKSLDIGIPYKFLNDSTFSIEDLKRQRSMKNHHNYSYGKFMFDVLAFFVILANIIYLPIRHSFNSDYDIYNKQQIEKITLFFHAAEICVNLSTQFYHRGILVKDRIRVTKRYLYGRIWIDLIVGVPYLLSILNPSMSSLNLLYLLKCLDFITIFNKIEDKILRKDHIGDALKCILLIFFVSHLSACSIHYISQLPKADSEKTYLDSVDVDITHWFQVYVYSFYWSIITMTTIGYGDIRPNSHRERLYATFFALLSCVVFGFTLNQIGSIISHIYMNSAQIRRKKAIIDSYMKQRDVSQDLQIKVKKNLEYISNDSGQQDKVVDEIINSLTTSLKNELKADLYKNILFKNVESFHFNFSDPFLYELSMLFQEQTFNQEQFIYNEKEASNKFYFIIRGEVEFIYKKNKCPYTAKKNEIVGLEEFFSQQQRQLSAKTSRMTTVAYITYEAFLDVLKRHQLDQETYKMIFDSMNLNGYTSRIQIKCYNCNSLSHKFIECPYLFFQKDERLFRENMVIKGEIYKIYGDPKAVCYKRSKGFKYNCLAKKNSIWGQLFNYLCDNLNDIETYYEDKVMMVRDQNSESQEEDENEEGEEGEDKGENDGEEDEEGNEQNRENYETNQGDPLNSKNKFLGDDEKSSPYVAIHMLKSQNRDFLGSDNNLKRQRMAIDLNNPMAQYFFAGKNRSSSNINIDQMQNQAATTAESQDYQIQNISNQQNIDARNNNHNNNNIPQIKLEAEKNIHNNINQQELQYKQNLNINDQSSSNENQLKIGQLHNKDNLSFSFNSNQKEEQNLALNMPYNKLSKHTSSQSPSEQSNVTLMNANHFPANKSTLVNLQLNSNRTDSKSQSQTPGVINSPQFFATPEQMNQKQIENFKFDMQAAFNNHQKQEIANSPNLQGVQYTPEHQCRKTSQFGGLYAHRKSAEIKKEEHATHLMPINNLQTGILDDSALSPAVHQIPQTWNPNSNMDNRYSLSGLNNEYIHSSGQDNNPQLSQLQLEPISPIKANTKIENTSPMISLNNKEIFSHSDLQFDIQSDNISQQQKRNIMNSLDAKLSNGTYQNKQLTNYDSEQNSNQKKFRQQFSQLSSSPSQNMLDERVNAYNIIGNKGKIPSSDNNSVSIKLDENGEYQPPQPQSQIDGRVPLARASSFRKASQKNNTILLFGQQTQIFNSELDNPTIGINTSNMINPLIRNQNTQGTLVSVKNDENYNTSQSFLHSAIHENTLEYHPSNRNNNKKLSFKKQSDLFNEKINSLQNSSQKERMKTFIQSRNSQKVIRSQRNIETGSLIIRKNQRKQFTGKISSASNQQLLDLLSQSQDVPNNLDPTPKLKKYQSARNKSPQMFPQDQNPIIYEMHTQQIMNNKRLLDQNFDKTHLTSRTTSQQTIPLLQLHQSNNNTHGSKISKQNIELDTLTHHDSRVLKHLNKQSTQKLQFKLHDDSQNSPTHTHQRDVYKNQIKFSINSSQNNSQSLIPRYDLRDEYDESEDSQQETFFVLSEFESLKSYKVYFPWNNYQRILKNLLNTKKKKKQDLISIFTSQKLKTRICRQNQNTFGEKDSYSKMTVKLLSPPLKSNKKK